MIIFAISDYFKRFIQPLRSGRPDASSGECEILRYTNGEMHALVKEDVGGQECLIIGSLAPPDDQLLSTLMLADALKRDGAKKVILILPYLGYARQDKFLLGESGGIALMGSLTNAAGADEIITIDVHSPLDAELVGLPLRSFGSASLFVPDIKRLGWDDATVVAPDRGAINRARVLASALNNRRPVAYLVKKRIDGIIHLGLSGRVTTRAILTDDIIDSGLTLISACRVLRENGVQDIAVAVTHGLFTDKGWKQLFELGVRNVYVTDSCPEAARQKHPKLKVISLDKLLPALLPPAARKEKRYEHAIA